MIVDVIQTFYQGRHYNYWVILETKNPRIYKEIKPNLFQSDTDGIYSALERRGSSGDAFAGREFTILVDDGREITCKGNFWDVSPIGDDLISVGSSTLEQLKKCYVFTSGCIKRSMLEEWLQHNKPKNQYEFYRNFPTEEEAKALADDWAENDELYHYLTYSSDHRMRIHLANKIKKDNEWKQRQLKYKADDIYSVEKKMVKLLAHLCKEEGVESEDDVIEYIEQLEKDCGTELIDEVSEILEEL